MSRNLDSATLLRHVAATPMDDEADPPRKIYHVKPREGFEQVNAKTSAPSEGPTDVAGHLKSAAADPRSARVNAPANRPNEVHAMLQHNLSAANAVGLNNVRLNPDYRSNHYRRVRRFCLFVVLFDGPVGAYAWWIGRQDAIALTFAIAAMAYFTSHLAWQTFFLNTE